MFEALKNWLLLKLFFALIRKTSLKQNTKFRKLLYRLC